MLPYFKALITYFKESLGAFFCIALQLFITAIFEIFTLLSPVARGEC